MKSIIKTLSLLMAVAFTTVKSFASPNAPDIVVAADGSGKFTSIQEAVMSIRDYKPTRTTIYIKNGVYKEKLLIPSNKCDITLIGESTEGVIITWNDYAALNDMGTFKTWTVKIDGSGIRMENITIENSAGRVGQAVALHTEGDSCEFVNCRLLGNQDTLFTGTGGHRCYFRNCYIEGTTDFIFGPATVWFEQCDIHCKSDSYITAASTPEEFKYGYVFNKCNITTGPEVKKMYLGRPWRAYASVIFMNCTMPSTITAEGWHNWGRVENEKTSRYMEYNNTGEGATVTGRVAWAKQLTKEQADKVTLRNVMKIRSEWKPAYDSDASADVKPAKRGEAQVKKAHEVKPEANGKHRKGIRTR